MRISTILKTQLNQHFVNDMKVYYPEDSYTVPYLPSWKALLRQRRALESKAGEMAKVGYLYGQQSKNVEHSESVLCSEGCVMAVGW